METVAGLTQVLLESSMQAKFLISMTAKRHFSTKLPAGTSGTGQSAMTIKTTPLPAHCRCANLVPQFPDSNQQAGPRCLAYAHRRVAPQSVRPAIGSPFTSFEKYREKCCRPCVRAGDQSSSNLSIMARRAATVSYSTYFSIRFRSSSINVARFVPLAATSCSS